MTEQKGLTKQTRTFITRDEAERVADEVIAQYSGWAAAISPEAP